MLAHNILVKSTAPSFSMYGRIKTGSFHEGMKKVLVKWLLVHHVINHGFCVLRLYVCCLCLFQGPGPAAYKVVDQTIYSKKAPSYSMTGRNFPPGESTQNPGPGAHCPEKVLIWKLDHKGILFIYFNFLLTFLLSIFLSLPSPRLQVTMTKGQAPSFTFGLRHSEQVYQAT